MGGWVRADVRRCDLEGVLGGDGSAVGPGPPSHPLTTGEERLPGEQGSIEPAVSLRGSGSGKAIRALSEEEFLLTFPFLFALRRR